MKKENNVQESLKLVNKITEHKEMFQVPVKTHNPVVCPKTSNLAIAS